MSVEKNVPQIRFKDFAGEWLDTTLSDVIDVRSGKDYKHLGKGNIPVYGTGGYMLSVDSALSNDEDAIGIGRKGTIDKPYLLRAPFWTVDTLFYAVPKPKFKLDYLYCLFQKIDWKKHDESTGVPSLSKVAINNIPVRVTSETEQTAIGNTFQKLDSLINQHQQKHDKLSSIKKAMLEKMFPKQGGTIPEIRFKGFSGEWEEKELSELTDYANGKGHEDKQKTSGKYELINLNSISIGGGLKPSGKFIDETNSTLEKNDLVMVLSDVGHGDLLGRVALIPKSNAYVLNQRVALLRPYGNVCPLFLLYNINAHQTYFKKQGAGMSQLNISKGSVESFYSCIPEREEQTAIGNYFQKLDVLIKHHQQQITKLNNIKQACLSKMFV
ncbi:restriction endonuclease subunit S [Shewanella oncorhynchi]|uniref:restriction endonuclease subunit S n=1 Tax=Shewanella TaxID=22 RepID=UPI0021DAF41D|nr:restriction endonuclease subunit S [Shewanella sp. SM69]MCU8040674.1 restriction endonuclease subunit S [Shewanella sp. SM69]